MANNKNVGNALQKTSLFLSIFILLIVSLLSIVAISTSVSGEMIVKNVTGVALTDVKVITNDPALVSVYASVDSIYVDACSYTKYDLTLYNPNDLFVVVSAKGVDSVVSSVLNGAKVSSWVAIPESTILNSHETKIIPVYVRAPCNAEGNYDLKLQFTISVGNTAGNADSSESSLTMVKELNQKISVRKILNNLFVKYSNNVSACPCTAMNYTIDVTNIGTFEDTFVLDTDNDYSDYVFYSVNNFNLPAQGTKQVYVSVNLPCDQYGEKEVPVNVNSLNNGNTAVVPLVSNVLQCYGFKVEGKNNVSVCKAGNDTFRYKITNNASFTNSYDIKLDGAMYSKLSGNYMTLNASQEGFFDVYVNPTKNSFFTYDSNDNFSIIVDSELGDAEVVTPVNVDLVDCYDLGFNTTETVLNFDVCPFDTKIPIYVSNNGKFNETVNFDVESNANLIYPVSFNLSAGEVKKLDLVINNTVKNGTSSLTTKDFSAQMSLVSQNNSNNHAEIRANFRHKTLAECYGFDIMPKKVSSSEAIINLTNIGSKDANYEIYVYSDGNYSFLNTSSMKLAAGQTGQFNLVFGKSFTNLMAVNETITTQMNVSINNTNASVNSTINGSRLNTSNMVAYKLVNVTKNQTVMKNVTKFAPFNVTTAGNNEYIAYITVIETGANFTKTIPVVYNGSNSKWLLWGIILFVVLLLLLLLLLVLFKNKKANSKKKEVVEKKNLRSTIVKAKVSDLKSAKKAKLSAKDKKNKGYNWIWILLILLLLLLIGAVWLFAVMPWNASGKDRIARNADYANLLKNISANDTVIEMNKDSVYTINLSKVFYDPDNQTLNYSGKSEKNLTLTINNSIVKIVPDARFTGIRKINFSAIDTEGGKAVSPNIKVLVKPQGVFYKEYSFELILTVVLVIGILLLLLKIKRKDEDD